MCKTVLPSILSILKVTDWHHQFFATNFALMLCLLCTVSHRMCDHTMDTGSNPTHVPASTLAAPHVMMLLLLVVLVVAYASYSCCGSSSGPGPGDVLAGP
jgi:hypothetical protein